MNQNMFQIILVRSADDTTIMDVNSVNGFIQMIVFPSRMVKPSYELRYFVVTNLNCLIVLLIFSNRNGSNVSEVSLLAKTKKVLRSNSTNSSHSVNSASEFSCCCSFCESGTKL